MIYFHGMSITHSLPPSILARSGSRVISLFLQTLGNINFILTLTSLMFLPDRLQCVEPLSTNLMHQRNIILTNILFTYNVVDKFVGQFVVPRMGIGTVKRKAHWMQSRSPLSEVID